MIKENFPQDRIINIGNYVWGNFKSKKLLKNSILKKMKLKNDFSWFQHIAKKMLKIKIDSKQLWIWFLYKKKYSKKVVISCHPRIIDKIKSKNKIFDKEIIISKPFSYSDYLKLQTTKLTISDSGTITEKSQFLGFKAINIRNNHERPEGMEEVSNNGCLNFEKLKAFGFGFEL